MRRTYGTMFAFIALGGILFVSCASVSSRLPAVSIPGTSVVKPAPVAVGVDFRDGEVLCATGADPYSLDFYTARVLTQASATTKNQAEVVFVRDGRKEWVNYVIPSRKATKQDLQVGKVLFVPVWHREDKEINEEDYRKGLWRLGRVTSTDELFKDLVEVKGEKYYWQYVRVPDREP
ncbi:MAG: hypothetical protein SNJ78_00410 [Spirochaetales bacterium]